MLEKRRILVRASSHVKPIRAENRLFRLEFLLMSSSTLETFPNPQPGRDYEIAINCPEFTSVCPKTGLPDFGEIRITYVPDARCLELKSLKTYLQAYRDLGIFYENAVNRILRDVVAACQPVWAVLRGDFTPRGGLRTSVEARYDRPQARAARSKRRPAGL